MAKTPTANRVKSDRPRPARDFYETPYGLCHAYLDQFVNIRREDYPYVLDAGAGTGIWGKAFRSIWSHAYITGVDLTDRPILGQDETDAYNAWDQEDYLNMEGTMITPDIIIGNPPYSLSEPFVRKSLELLDYGGEIHFLLPTQFLGSKKRMFGLFREFPPELVTISAKRPSFFSVISKKTGKLVEHSTDAIEYAVFYWIKRSSPKVTFPCIRWFDWSYD